MTMIEDKIRQLVLLELYKAELLALEVEFEGMKAYNLYHEDSYSEEDFDDHANKIRDVKTEIFGLL